MAKDRLKKVEIPTGQAPEANLPITKRVNSKSKGPRSPRGGTPKQMK
jgi:hypothetical protein